MVAHISTPAEPQMCNQRGGAAQQPRAAKESVARGAPFKQTGHWAPEDNQGPSRAAHDAGGVTQRGCNTQEDESWRSQRRYHQEQSAPCSRAASVTIPNHSPEPHARRSKIRMLAQAIAKQESHNTRNACHESMTILKQPQCPIT